jgi:hypothetical protein
LPSDNQNVLRLGVLTVALGSAVALSPLPAQSIRTLDLRGDSHKASRKSFYVVLAARGGSATGHAFAMWGIEDRARHRSSIRAFGLYPDGKGANCGALVRNVPGGILDEMKNHSFQTVTEELIVRVDEAAFTRSWKVARQWDCRHQFSLLNRDCVEFLRAVGESAGLNMPSRSVTQWTPQAYVRALMASRTLIPSTRPAAFP